MTPFIRDGDVITVAPALTSTRPCGVGHVVAFVSPVNQKLVVHRVIGRHHTRFLIRGDNMREPAVDAVSPDGIIGRVVRIERGGKSVWLGLGPERYLVAILSRAGLLLPLLLRVGVLARLLRKRRHQGD